MTLLLESAPSTMISGTPALYPTQTAGYSEQYYHHNPARALLLVWQQ
jgi:hypothetical protein